MSESVLRPQDEAQIREAVAWAVSHGEPLEIVGHGSKRVIGNPVQAAHTLDLSEQKGITLYEPEELVLTAKAGTPVVEIEKLLEDNGQELQFEPMDYRALLGNEARRGTVGGLLACNLSGPRRIKSGAARDHVLGIRAVTGRADIIKSGGRVMKNVTGYDLPRGLAGSWGTLAVFTEITLKVLPRTETQATFIISGLDDAMAAGAMARAMGSSAEVSGAAHLSESVRNSFVGGVLPEGAATVLRLEGFRASVDYRLDKLHAMFSAEARCDRLDAEMSAALWREIRDVKPYCDGGGQPVWRVSVAPSKGFAMVGSLRMHTGVDAFYDWQGGLVWMRMEADCEADLVRAAIRQYGGGHATLVRAPLGERAAIPVFEPPAPALAALEGRLKLQFDPDSILNPGKYGAGT